MRSPQSRRRVGAPPACSCPCTFGAPRPSRCPDLTGARTSVRLGRLRTRGRDIHTSERVDGDEHRANVGVDLCVLPPFIEVLVDALVRDGGEKGHIGHADLLLLEALLPVCLQDTFFLSASHSTSRMYAQRHTFATLFAPPFLGVAAAPPFLPAFLEGA